MNNQPLVSVVMNCYNGERHLKEAIDSIYKQTYRNWEIIFWDNFSNDASAKIAKSYDNRVKYFLAAETSPLGEARNFALNKVSGKYIAFLDCDDVYLTYKLEQQVNLMESKKYVMCYGSVSVINEEGKEFKKNIVKNKSGNLFSSLLEHYEINMQTVMLNKDYIFNNQLSFNENMSFCPDHNLFMTVASQSDIGVIIDIVAKYRVVENSLSKKTIDIASKEYRFTLDAISQARPLLKKKFANEFTSAYRKAMFYEIVADIYHNQKKEARNKLRKIYKFKIEYFLLYLLLFVPISNKFILKLLRR
jgi:glycosyltransferase involved in cell wall biosynthesis